MVVRLKDLNKDEQTTESSPKKGPVRLSDLNSAPAVKSSATPVISDNNLVTRRAPINGAVEMDDMVGTPLISKPDVETRARNLPIIGPVLKGLDYIAEKTDPVADVLRSFYIPGAGLSNIAGLTGAAEAGVARLLPSLGGSTVGRITQKGLSEAIVGAPLGAAQQQIAEPDSRTLTSGIVTGALTGGAFGAAGSAAKQGIVRLVDMQANKLAQNALRNAAENSRSAVVSPFAGGSAAGNPVARGYTENVARTFGNAPSRLADDIAPSNVIQPLRSNAAASNADSVVGRPITEPVTQQTPQVLTRSNAMNQLENGKFSNELNDMIRNSDNSYKRVTNVQSVNKANENLKNMTEAESKFLLNESGGADHIATGYRLMQELDALGEHGRALVVSQKLAQDLTKSGQTSQAASILQRLSPEGQLLNLVRTAERNGKVVTEADSIKFKQLAAQVQEKSGAGIRANQFNEILNRMERGEDVGVDDIKKLSKFLSGAEKVTKPKAVKVIDDIPAELKEPRKREKVISFFDGAEQAALSRIAARKNRLNSLPIDEWKDHAIVVASQIAKGSIKAATHVEDLVKLFGEEIRPVATQVFQKAQGLVKGVSRGVSEDKLDKANQMLRRISGQDQAEKEIVKETAAHVRKLIVDAKDGKLTVEDVQKLRDYADEIAEMTSDKPQRVVSQEQKFMLSVKSLAKKIAQVESEKVPADQANREVSSLLRQITKIADEGEPAAAPEKLDSQALSDIAHDVMRKTRPHPKPTTLQEKIVEKYIKQNPQVTEKDVATLRQLAKDVTRLSDNQKIDADIAMQRILNSYEKSSMWDKLLSVRYMSMLLNSSTQLVNAISGPTMATTGYAADVLGTMVDIAMNKALKTPRTTTLYGSNPLQFIARYWKNLKTGAKAGWQGVNPAGIQSTNEIRGLAFKSPFNPLGIAERTLGAVAKGADYATYKSVFDSEIVKQGFLDAKNKGIKGKQNIQQHIDQFVNNPPEEAILNADRIGKNTTFQRSDTTGGKVANFLNSSPNAIKPAVNAIFPFVRTPVNIASTAVTLTPAGIVKGLYQLTSKSQASQREAIRTLSLGLTGSAGIGSLGYYLQQIGVITGANDSGDKDVDSIREQAGKGKYRFNTSALERYLDAMFNGEGSEAAEKAAQYRKGDSAFDYNKLQPLAFPLAIGASLAENKDKPLAERAAEAGSDAFGSLYGMSTLKGVQDVFQPSYGGTVGEKALGAPMRIAESFFKSFSPSMLAQEARRQDPVQRKTPYNDGLIPDVKGYFQSRTPGLSQSLPPNKTTLGISKLNAPQVRGQYANPYKSEVAPYSEAAKVISDLIDRTGDMSLAPSAPEKTVRGKDRKGVSQSVSIPQERYAKLQEEVGNEIIKNVMRMSPTLSDDKKAEKLKDIYAAARENGRNKVKRELGLH
jgi:hypothetical protein